MLTGAILTQNTSWKNVETAIAVLRQSKLLSAAALATTEETALQPLIRSAGFFRQKARHLHFLAQVIVQQYGGDAAALLQGELPVVRKRLLALPGIGEETADSMLLYGGGHATFVIDSYTRRILTRSGWSCMDKPYKQVQQYFMDNLPADAALYNEYHALIVRLAKDYCRSRNPVCSDCLLASVCVFAQKG